MAYKFNMDRYGVIVTFYFLMIVINTSDVFNSGDVFINDAFNSKFGIEFLYVHLSYILCIISIICFCKIETTHSWMIFITYCGTL